jgi:DNA-binding beta-propeller fold protein YncE
VNHLSDSVSVVRLDDAGGGGLRARVARTLLVGDEPRDIVFAGVSRTHAFVTAAHRGQSAPFDPQLTTPGIGRADVWVFDADELPESGAPATIISLFSDTPRALAVSPDGATVYAAAFLSGNRTSIVNELALPDDMQLQPRVNHAGLPQPKNTFVVRYDGAHWYDKIGRNWDEMMNFSLPDKDVFAIDATANPPAPVAGAAGFFPSVGTVLYNMAVNPVSGKVYVSNTDALNQHRFEGPGVFAGETVRGHHNENRITVLDPGGPVRVAPHHLNPHIDYSHCCDPIPNDENARSLALPTGMAVSSDGATLYVAALGSDKVGIYDTQELETDAFVPSVADQVPVSGGGPTGIVLDEKNRQLLVMTRFDDGISLVDVDARQEVGKASMFNPEPPSVTRGRRFLYDASFSSSHGDSACATCHVFGDFDALAWDLGNPDGDPLENLNPLAQGFFPPLPDPSFQPMKGPMSTQSLRGMANDGPMHWRGDRNGALDAPSFQPNSGAYDEKAGFIKFQAGFINLLGRDGPIPDEDMSAFADFILQVMYPPNPNRPLDNQLTADQAAGRDYFMNRVTETGTNTCNSCHRIDPNGNAELGVPIPGFFGTDGRSVKDPFPQMFKIPQLRNLYQKVGMFGFPTGVELVPGLPLVPAPLPGLDGYLGDQIRGFGTNRAGDFDTPLRFVSNIAFSSAFPILPNPGGFGLDAQGLVDRRQLVSFLFAFDTNLAPVVGQQVTLSHQATPDAPGRVALLEARADAGECDLVAKADLADGEHGYLYVGTDTFIPDRASAPAVSTAALASLVTGPPASVTLTCTPPGSGRRLGIDRDLDGILDGDQ